MERSKARFPPEILIEIIKLSKDDVPSLKMLSLVNSMFRDVATPLLYRDIVLRGGGSSNPSRTLSELSACPKIAKYVESVTIRGSAVICAYLLEILKIKLLTALLINQSNLDYHTRERDPESNHERYERPGFSLAWDLIDFLKATKETLKGVTIDWAEEKGITPGGEISDLSHQYGMDILVAALRSVELPMLTTLKTNLVPPTYFQFFGSLRHRLINGSNRSKCSDGIFSRNLKSLRSVTVEEKGLGSEGDIGYYGQSDLYSFFGLFSKYATDLKALTVSLSKLEEYEGLLTVPLSLLNNTNLVSLALDNLLTLSLGMVLQNCQLLKSISLSRMRDTTSNSSLYPGPEATWRMIFTHCQQLPRLKRLHVDQLTICDLRPCRMQKPALTYDGRVGADADALIEAVHQIIARGGTVTQGDVAENEKVNVYGGDGGLTLRLCRHYFGRDCDSK